MAARHFVKVEAAGSNPVRGALGLRIEEPFRKSAIPIRKW